MDGVAGVRRLATDGGGGFSQGRVRRSGSLFLSQHSNTMTSMAATCMASRWVD
jgi:hypothetical protein